MKALIILLYLTGSLLTGSFISSSDVFAHQTKPTIVDVSFNKVGSINIRIQTNLESILAGINSQHKDTDDAPQADLYNNLRKLTQAELKQQFIDFESTYRHGLKLTLTSESNSQELPLKLSDLNIPKIGDTRLSRMSIVSYTALTPKSAQYANWTYHKKFGDNIIRYSIEGIETKVSHWLKNGQISPDFVLSEDVIPKSQFQVAWQYIVLGFEHILPKGLDHILFVLGLFLLSTKMSPLLWQVTAFTFAHTITLGMSIYGLISLPATIVEPLISLSIAYVGIENLITKQLKPWRVIIVFIFGLLHGMGFASVLTELGLPSSEYLTALISFNIGVEFGQLSVILGAFLLVGWISYKTQKYRQFVIIPGSLAIAVMGLFWTYQRII